VEELPGMTLWELMLAVSSTMFLAGGLAIVKVKHIGFAGTVAVVAVGLVLAPVNFLVVNRIGKKLSDAIKRYPESSQEAYFRAMYFGLALWILAALFGAAWITSVVVKAVTPSVA
jgi:hypothetical protein